MLLIYFFCWLMLVVFYVAVSSRCCWIMLLLIYVSVGWCCFWFILMLVHVRLLVVCAVLGVHRRWFILLVVFVGLFLIWFSQKYKIKIKNKINSAGHETENQIKKLTESYGCTSYTLSYIYIWGTWWKHLSGCSPVTYTLN
jgi:hypothetical protein